MGIHRFLAFTGVFDYILDGFPHEPSNHGGLARFGMSDPKKETTMKTSKNAVKKVARKLATGKFAHELSEAKKAEIFQGMVERTMENIMREFSDNNSLMKNWLVIEALLIGQVQCLNTPEHKAKVMRESLGRHIDGLVKSAIMNIAAGEAWPILTHWEILSKRVQEAVRLTNQEAHAVLTANSDYVNP
ncbi:MAG: hypothetical protein WCI76_01820 [bacterium]